MAVKGQAFDAEREALAEVLASVAEAEGAELPGGHECEKRLLERADELEREADATKRKFAKVQHPTASVAATGPAVLGTAPAALWPSPPPIPPMGPPPGPPPQAVLPLLAPGMPEQGQSGDLLYPRQPPQTAPNTFLQPKNAAAGQMNFIPAPKPFGGKAKTHALASPPRQAGVATADQEPFIAKSVGSSPAEASSVGDSSGGGSSFQGVPKVAAQGTSQTNQSNVSELLESVNLGMFIDPLVELGVEKIKDFHYVTNRDLEKMGMSGRQRQKFKELVRTRNSPGGAVTSSATAASGGNSSSRHGAAPPSKSLGNPVRPAAPKAPPWVAHGAKFDATSGPQRASIDGQPRSNVFETKWRDMGSHDIRRVLDAGFDPDTEVSVDYERRVHQAAQALAKRGETLANDDVAFLILVAQLRAQYYLLGDAGKHQLDADLAVAVNECVTRWNGHGMGRQQETGESSARRRRRGRR